MLPTAPGITFITSDSPISRSDSTSSSDIISNDNIGRDSTNSTVVTALVL